MNRLLYFAYGSNILKERIEDRLGKVCLIRPYKLYGWKLSWTGGVGSYANIGRSESPNDFVEGILYELTEHQIHRLDFYEGYPHCYEKIYKIEGEEIIFAYWTPNPIEYRGKRVLNSLPDLKYLNIIIAGCWQHGLLQTHAILVNFRTMNYTNIPPKRIVYADSKNSGRKRKNKSNLG
jgi:hypothetical protein